MKSLDREFAPLFTKIRERNMEVEAAIQQLSSNGLVIVNHLQSSHILVGRTVEPIDNESEMASVVDTSILIANNGKWRFRKWAYVPGPGPDDVDFEAQNLDETVVITLNYYFGQPEIRQGWILPVHKHPEWSEQLLNTAIENAIQITTSEWEVIRAPYHQQRRQLLPRGTLSEIFACVFNPIMHSKNPALTLYLRRDLREAFVVESKI